MSRRVWLTAALVGALFAGLIAVELLEPRDVYTGTNHGENAGASGVVVTVAPGQRLCVPGLLVPAGTGRVRLSTVPGALVRAQVTVGTQRFARQVPAGDRLDIAIPKRPAAPEATPGAVCVTPEGTPLGVTGRVGLQGNERPPTLDGRPLPDQVALRYLPPAGERPSLLSQLGAAFERAARFRPGVVGAWTYVVLFAVLLPALALLAIRLLARSAAGRPLRAPALTIAAIAFAVAASWALLSPPLTSPDEAEHFAYAQHLAETGRPPDLHPGREPYSSEERVAFEGNFLLGQITQRAGRPPWLAREERAWAQRERRLDPRRDDGGGQIAIAPYTPLYYAAAAPAYLAGSGQSIWTRIFLLRLLSAALGAVLAACAFLLVRELLPTVPWAPVAAGLLVAFQPMVAFMSGSINNDAAVNALGALLLYLLVRGLRRGLTARLGVAIGVVLMALPLAKGSGFFLYPAAAAGLAAMAWRARRAGGGAGWRPFAAVAAGFAAALGAWAVAAALLDRDLVPLQSGYSLVGGIQFHPILSRSEYGAQRALEHPGAFLSYTWQVFLPKLPFMTDLRPHPFTLPAFNVFVERSWGAFGTLTVLFPKWVFGAISAAMGAVGLLGLAALRRERAAVRRRLPEIAVLALAVAGVVIGFEAVYFATAPGRTFVIEQGRYAFPAVAAIAAFVVGACFGAGRRAAPLVATALVVATIGLGVAAQLLVLSAAYT